MGRVGDVGMHIELVTADPVQDRKPLLHQPESEFPRPETGAPALQVVGIVNPEQDAI